MILLDYHFSYLEILATIFSFIAIILATKAYIINWPISIIGQLFFFIFFIKNELYANSFLQVFFTIMSIYGWYNWKNEDTDKIKILTKKKLIYSGIITIISILIFWEILSFYQKDYVLLDVSTTILSVVAIYLLTKKYLENWILWVIIDILNIFLFYLKGMYIISIEYIFITFLAFYGWYSWLRMYKKQ